MDFDQMLDAWKTQDEAPLYGVNRDLLQLVLRGEQAKIKRKLRRDQLVAYIVGPAMALFSGFWLWVAILRKEPLIHTLAAGLSVSMFLLWVGAYWVSRRRQARRERHFGNTLHEEVSRSLSLIEYQIINGRWHAALLWTLPVMIGASLIYWLTFQINNDTSFSVWNHVFIGVCILWALVWSAYGANIAVKRKLEPRRERLRALRDMLQASE